MIIWFGGEGMKKIIVIFLAFLCGGALGIGTLFFVNKEQKTIQESKIYALQIGRFLNLENAFKKQKELPSSIVVQDDDSYLVLAGISLTPNNIEKMESILKERKIPYYKKEMNIDFENLEEVKRYSILLEKASEEETVLFLNQKLLESVKVYDDTY